jgi:hypothetical protein
MSDDDDNENKLAKILLQKREKWLKAREEASRLERENWENRVKELYDDVKNWLKPLKEEDLLEFIEHSEAILNSEGEEEKIIHYFSIEFFNGKTIDFEPLGLNIGGESSEIYGQVKMKLDVSNVMIEIKNQDANWKFVSSDEQKESSRYEEFSQENLEQFITDFVQRFEDKE